MHWKLPGLKSDPRTVVAPQRHRCAGSRNTGAKTPHFHPHTGSSTVVTVQKYSDGRRAWGTNTTARADGPTGIVSARPNTPTSLQPRLLAPRSRCFLRDERAGAAQGSATRGLPLTGVLDLFLRPFFALFRSFVGTGCFVVSSFLPIFLFSRLLSYFLLKSSAVPGCTLSTAPPKYLLDALK